MARQMNASASAAVVVPASTTETKTAAELHACNTLPLVQYVTAAGEARQAVRLHSLSYLPERIGEDGKPQSARFGGFLSEWTDPTNGVVYGTNRDSVPLQFFGKAADDLRAIMGSLADPKRDAILLALNGPAETLQYSVHRNTDGSVRQLAVGTREFRGNFKKLIAAPAAVVAEE